MKKWICIILVICTLASLTACGAKKEEEAAAGFKPALDPERAPQLCEAGRLQ